MVMMHCPVSAPESPTRSVLMGARHRLPGEMPPKRFPPPTTAIQFECRTSSYDDLTFLKSGAIQPSRKVRRPLFPRAALPTILGSFPYRPPEIPGGRIQSLPKSAARPEKAFRKHAGVGACGPLRRDGSIATGS